MVDASSTILAFASAPGHSPRGIIRISGPGTFDLLREQVSFAESETLSARRARRGTFKLTRDVGIPILALVFPAPHSYTGEDSIELQLPGNPILLDRVIDTLLQAAPRLDIDARRASPGEFTARAYFNGRMSLTQAEGVAATIAAQSDAELRAAQLLLSGTLGSFAHELADALAGALALVEAGIDFTDQEDVVAISAVDLHTRLRDLHGRIADQLNHSIGSEQLQAIPWVVLIGEPNAGKSALFNALLGRERAVVSPMAGTTRDVLAEPLTIQTGHGPAEVMLVDLAGLDETDGSTINRLMQVAARDAIDRAELILRCVPTDQGAQPPRPNELIVHTKSDLAISRPYQFTVSPFQVSAFTGAGLDELKSLIADRLSDRAVSLAAHAMALRPRHEAALRSALENLSEALELVEPSRRQRALPHPELVASSMRAALDDLAALAGDITPDDVLGRVFATFCVGK